MDFNYVSFPDHLTCKCTLYKKMRHFCDIGLHNCNFLLDYNDLTHKLSILQHHIRRNKKPLQYNKCAVPESNDILEIFFLCFLTMRSIPLPNTVRPVCPNSNQPQSETNCQEQISPNAFYPLIRKPRCPTPTRKFRNGYVISIEKKMRNRITPPVTQLFIKSQWKG